MARGDSMQDTTVTYGSRADLTALGRTPSGFTEQYKASDSASSLSSLSDVGGIVEEEEVDLNAGEDAAGLNVGEEAAGLNVSEEAATLSTIDTEAAMVESPRAKAETDEELEAGLAAAVAAADYALADVLQKRLRQRKLQVNLRRYASSGSDASGAQSPQRLARRSVSWHESVPPPEDRSPIFDDYEFPERRRTCFLFSVCERITGMRRN
jgi:hypothetical protein